jgi:hypothetical protein
MINLVRYLLSFVSLPPSFTSSRLLVLIFYLGCRSLDPIRNPFWKREREREQRERACARPFYLQVPLPVLVSSSCFCLFLWLGVLPPFDPSLKKDRCHPVACEHACNADFCDTIWTCSGIYCRCLNDDSGNYYCSPDCLDAKAWGKPQF